MMNLDQSPARLRPSLSPEESSRYHSFGVNWGPGEEVASMRNGSGDEFDIVFSAAGAYIRGFAYEAMMSPYGNDGPWPGVLDSFPRSSTAIWRSPRSVTRTACRS